MNNVNNSPCCHNINTNDSTSDTTYGSGREHCVVEWCALEASGGRRRRVAGDGGEWWSAKLSGGCGSRMVGARGEWWVAEESGGRRRQVVVAIAE